MYKIWVHQSVVRDSEEGQASGWQWKLDKGLDQGTKDVRG